jgi:hypothetical protein
MIQKNISQEEELSLMQCVLMDETGMINAIFKGDKIGYAKIGDVIIIRSVQMEILNNRIILIVDENSDIFSGKNLLDTENMFKFKFKTIVDINFSHIKLNKFNSELDFD